MFNFATKMCLIWRSGRVAGSDAVHFIVFVVRGGFSLVGGGGAERWRTAYSHHAVSVPSLPISMSTTRFCIGLFLVASFFLLLSTCLLFHCIRITKQNAIPTYVYAICRERNVVSTIITTIITI